MLDNLPQTCPEFFLSHPIRKVCKILERRKGDQGVELREWKQLPDLLYSGENEYLNSIYNIRTSIMVGETIFGKARMDGFSDLRRVWDQKYAGKKIDFKFHLS